MTLWSRRRDSNPEPAVYKTAALPIELRRHDGQGHTADDPFRRRGMIGPGGLMGQARGVRGALGFRGFVAGWGSGPPGRSSSSASVVGSADVSSSVRPASPSGTVSISASDAVAVAFRSRFDLRGSGVRRDALSSGRRFECGRDAVGLRGVRREGADQRTSVPLLETRCRAPRSRRPRRAPGQNPL